jgi:hypothetical protein
MFALWVIYASVPQNRAEGQLLLEAGSGKMYTIGRIDRILGVDSVDQGFNVL